MNSTVKLSFIGDVMIGRAIDRILPDHVNGILYENCIKHSDRYVELAEKANGRLPWKEIRERGHMYIWGDILHELQNSSNCLIINLETVLTINEAHDPETGIHFRSHPSNVKALNIAGVNIATLANNHALDWKEEGLQETILVLEKSGILCAGAGLNIEHARCPAVAKIKVPNLDQSIKEKKTKEIHVVVAAYGFQSSGVPRNWAAQDTKSGINFVSEPNNVEAALIHKQIKSVELNVEERINIVSIHWGPKWGWGIPKQWRFFAQTLIDQGVDAVIGHSSHHVKGIEVYKGKLIVYGLGNFINDFEGIVNQGFEEFRNDLCCLYLPTFDTRKGILIQLDIVPCKIKHFKVQRATNANEIDWIREVLCKEGESLGTSCVISKDAFGNINLSLKWNE